MDVQDAKLTAYLDGELLEPELGWVKRRLSDSPWLRDRLDQLRLESELIDQALDSLAPADIVTSSSLALQRFRSRVPAGD